MLFVVAVLLLAPEAQSYLPFDGSGNLTLGAEEFTTGRAIPVSWEPISKALELALGLTGSMVFMVPVSWIYMGARRRRGRPGASQFANSPISERMS